jgi:hypothetical protein
MITIEVNGQPLRVVSCSCETRYPITWGTPSIQAFPNANAGIPSGHVEIDLLWQYADRLEGDSIRIYGGGDTLFEGQGRKSYSLTDKGDGRVVYEAEYERSVVYRVERRAIAGELMRG